VVVERTSFLRFLKLNFPAVLNTKLTREQLKTQEAIRRLAEALRENPDMAKAVAADLVGWPGGSRRFENEIWPEARKRAGLGALGRPGRKAKSPQI
jgi:hypothetical protein